MSTYYASENNPEAVKGIAERFGFCLVKNLFSADEIQDLERTMADAHDAFGGNFPDLDSCPSLRWVMLDERVRAIAKALLGETLVYYRETNIVFEHTPGPATKKPYFELHYDARGVPESLFRGWDSVGARIYPAYRFAFYFRDYEKHSGGLKVAVGSHLRLTKKIQPFSFSKTIEKLPKATHWFERLAFDLPVPPFELFNVPSTPGDLVIFNLRTYHSAGAVRMRDRPTFATLPLIENAIRASEPGLCLPTPPGCRNVIFFDYGAPSQEVDFYTKWRALDSPWPAGIKPMLRERNPDGITYRNDRVITSIAMRLGETLKDPIDGKAAPPELNTLSSEARDDIHDLLRLCREHREFSPHHPLFNANTFLRNVDTDPMKAAVEVVRDVYTHRAALLEEEAKARESVGIPKTEAPP